MTKPTNELIKELFSKANTVLIATHIRPDGDAIGSMLGLGIALKEAGKTVTMINKDGIPAQFIHLPGAREVKRKISETEIFDLTISVDTSDIERSGNVFGTREIILNIDHHITNTNFGKFNYVDPEAVATSSLLAGKIEAWGLKYNPEIARLFMIGLITDSLGFRTSNMNSESLRIAASLIEQGADLPGIYQEVITNKRFEQVNYWGYALVKLERIGRLGWTSLTVSDRAAAGYNGNDDADLNALLSNIADCNITLLFIEQSNGTIKVSLRGKPGFNVADLAVSLGGGGHPAAAGIEMKGKLAEVQSLVIEKTLNIMNKKNYDPTFEKTRKPFRGEK
jgi:phosphoesterase RecJ-like protein